MIFNKTLPWNSDAASILKQFLRTGVGQVFIATLAAQRPSLTTANNLDEAALQGKLAAGYEKALDNIMLLSEPVDEDILQAEGSTFRDLEDDSQWNDKDLDRFGQKIEPGAQPPERKKPETLAEKSAAAEKAVVPTPEKKA